MISQGIQVSVPITATISSLGKDAANDCIYLRLFVVDDKADEVSVVAGPVAFPGQFDPGTAGAVGLKLQDSAFT